MLIFITGHRKSGTTLLHSLFDNHPDIDVYPTDFTFFYSYFPYYTKNLKNKKKLIERIMLITNNTINKYFIKKKILTKKEILFFNKKLLKKLEKINLRSKKSIFKVIINHWINLKGKRIKKKILIKETSQSIYFDEYKKIFPNLKMINIVRDPRDNFASIKSGQKKYYSKIGLSYLQNFANVLFRSRQDLLSCFYNKKNKRFKFITYENLVKNPKKTMKRLCLFLKIKYSDILVNPTFGGNKFYGNNFNKKFIGISKNNANNWRKRITSEESNIIEFYLSDMLKIYKYKTFSNKIKIKKDFSKFNDLINSKYFFVDSFKNVKK